ncbi:hypothetical protein M758_1G135600 [Ceratodon purpureus]|nr:hypothetical protein M758_1G135600 [Ceratodon purpureus]
MVFPTSTMIREALTCIRKRKGTNLTEIHKHLEANHNKKLDGSNKRMLTSMLRGLVKTGQLEKKNANYKLATNPEDADLPNRRHHHCTRPTRFRRGYREPNRRGHRHCPRRRRRRSRRRRSRRRRRHSRRRRHRRRRSRRRRRPPHRHCKRSYRYKRGFRVSKTRMGHRHCPRR